MNQQERDEVVELVLRAIRLNFNAGVLHASRNTDLDALMRGDDEAATAERELWEALLRVRLDERRDGTERTRSTDPHSD